MAKHAHSRDLHVRVRYGDLLVHLTAEGASYSPDALDDMSTRALEAFAEAWRLVEPYERFAVTMREELEGIEAGLLDDGIDDGIVDELVEEDHED